MMERLQSVPQEERERMIARMRERGFDPGQLSSPAPANGGGAGPTAPPPRLSSGASSAKAPDLQNSGATTIDALFGPLEPTVSFGRVWVYANTQLKPVRVRLGVSDGTYTELLSGELQPGAELVTSVVTGLETRRPAGGGGPNNSPFMPGGPPRGIPGGGGGRGPGGGGPRG